MKTRRSRTALLIAALLLAAAALPSPTSAGDLGSSMRLVYPNPFTVSTTFQLSMPRPGKVRIVVYDLLGKEVSILKDDVEYAAGNYDVFWHGNDKNGTPVPPGMYICVLFSEGIAVKSVKVVKIAV
jgi:hypothetical protein